MSFFETETSSRNKNLLAIGISLSNIFKIQTEVNKKRHLSRFGLLMTDFGMVTNYRKYEIEILTFHTSYTMR